MSAPGQDYSSVTDADLMQALRAADAAGDEASAGRLAQIIQGRQSGASPQETSIAAMQDPNPISRYGKMGVSAALQGAGQLVGLPGTIENLANRGIYTGLNYLTGANVPAPPVVAPSGADIVGGLTDLGLTNRRDAVPLTPGERLATGAIEGAVMGGPFGLAGAGLGALSGAASEGAHELWPKSSLAPIAAGMATGFGVGGLATGVENLLTGRALARGVESAEAEVNAAQAARQSIPGSAAQVADSVSPAQTLQEAGTHLQQEARKWAIGDPANGVKSTLQTKLDAAWDPVTQQIGSNTPINLTNLDKAISDITTSAGKLEPMAKLLRPKAPDELNKALSNIKEFIGMGGAGLPEWSEVAQLRTILGDARGNPKIVEDIGQQNLSRLYKALSDDMRLAAKNKGPDALKAFDSANAESSRLYGIAKDQVQPLLDANPEDAASKLLSGARRGGTDLKVLRGEMPQAVDSLAAAHMRTAGKDWGKLAPEGKLALAGDQSVVDQMDSIIKSGAKENITTAKQALDAARAAVKAHAAPRYNPMEGVLGSGIGYDLGVLGLNAAGFSGHDILGGATGSLLGAAATRLGAPLVRGLVQNPRYPLIGAITGQAPANQLTATQIGQ